jgi:hypothetical protein
MRRALSRKKRSSYAEKRKPSPSCVEAGGPSQRQGSPSVAQVRPSERLSLLV